MKVLVVILIFSLSLLADSFHFKESRYIYSIDKSLEMEGRITFERNGMHIDYSEPEVRHILYTGRAMDVVDSNGNVIQHIDLNKEPMMKIYMDFLEKLYRGDYDALRDDFKVQKTETVVILTPIAPIDKVVTSVLVHKNSKGLQQIKTKMSSGDEFTIHITQ